MTRERRHLLLFEIPGYGETKSVYRMVCCSKVRELLYQRHCTTPAVHHSRCWRESTQATSEGIHATDKHEILSTGQTCRQSSKTFVSKCSVRNEYAHDQQKETMMFGRSSAWTFSSTRGKASS